MTFFLIKAENEAGLRADVTACFYKKAKEGKAISVNRP
jgi:hypothetical protein